MFSEYVSFVIVGNNIDSNATSYWEEVVRPCIEFGIPWAIVFGNHDDLSERNGTRAELMKFDMRYDLSLSQFGPSNIHGISNYFLEIQKSKEDQPGRIIYDFILRKSQQKLRNM